MKNKKIVYKYKDFIKVEKFFLQKKKIANFHRIKLLDGCMVLVTFKDEILILKEFRAAFNNYTYGLPGGLIDNKETPTQCIKREMLEEVGIKAKKLKKIFRYKRNGNYDCGSDIIFHYTAQNKTIFLEKDVKHKWIKPKKIINMIRKDQFKTPGVVAALLFFLVINKNLKLNK